MKFKTYKKFKNRKIKTKKIKTKKIKTKKIKKNIKLAIKDLGKKRKKYKRVQYGCSNAIKGGGPLFQPVTNLYRSFENNINNTFNTMYGNDSQEYNYTNY